MTTTPCHRTPRARHTFHPRQSNAFVRSTPNHHRRIPAHAESSSAPAQTPPYELLNTILATQSLTAAKAAISAKPTASEITNNVLNVPVVSTIIQWTLNNPVTCELLRNDESYRAKMSNILAALDAGFEPHDARSARGADVLHTLTTFTHYTDTITYMYAVFNKQRAKKVEAVLMQVSTQENIKKIIDITDSVATPARAKLVSGAVDAALYNNRIVNMLAILDAFMTTTRLDKFQSFFKSIDEQVSSEQLATSLQLLLTVTTAPRVQSFARIADEFITPNRIGQGIACVAEIVTLERTKRLASIFDYTITRQRVDDVASLVPQLYNSLSESLFESIGKVVDVSLQPVFAQRAAEVFDQSATLERARAYGDALDAVVSSTRVTRALDVLSTLANGTRTRTVITTGQDLTLDIEEASLQQLFEVATKDNRLFTMVECLDIVLLPRNITNVSRLFDALVSEPRLSRIAAFFDNAIGERENNARARDTLVEFKVSDANIKVLDSLLSVFLSTDVCTRVMGALNTLVAGDRYARFLESLDLVLSAPGEVAPLEQLVTLLKLTWDVVVAVAKGQGDGEEVWEEREREWREGVEKKPASPPEGEGG